jgi:3',5'-cyclic AMP phosphodiesterase CpdA
MSDPKPTIKTKVLIISDTHGIEPPTNLPDLSLSVAMSKVNLNGHPLPPKPPYHPPLPSADVAIHCGDLTKRSTIDEYRAAMRLLLSIDAPIRIAIAGNHDLALDPNYYKDHGKKYMHRRVDKRDWYAKHVKTQDDVFAIINESQTKGVYYIKEGVHDFTLKNGAKLRIYASPWTPIFGGWAFQYDRGKHRFDIPADVDFAVTHGPPHGLLDLAWDGSRAGCPNLLQAIYKSKPRVHCYGHIHEGWGAYLGEWKELSQKEPPTYLSIFDQDKSRVLEDIEKLRVTSADNTSTKEEKKARYSKYSEAGSCEVDVSPEGDVPVEKGKRTLFVNAAVLDARYKISNFPWIVNIDLAAADK